MEELLHSHDELKAAVEAVLFSMGDAVEASQMAIALDVTEKVIKNTCYELMKEYEASERGIRLIELDGSFQMCTNPKYYDALVQICHVPKKHNLTGVMLETLSIIAYKQPVTRQEIEAIRGVKSDFAVNKLLEYNLITELGRKEVPGRPILFGTSEEFLRCFGLSSASELPVISTDKIEEFRQEALQETNLSEAALEELKQETATEVTV